MVTAFLSRCVILAVGTLYPAYKSYKAVKSRDPREYLFCLKYWIVYAVFTLFENFCDIFFSWIPFYHELKITFIMCLLYPPCTNFIYKSLILPKLVEHEEDIDDFLRRTKTTGCTAVVNFGSKGLRYASNLFLNTAMIGSAFIEQRLKKSVSTKSLNESKSINEDYDVYFDRSDNDRPYLKPQSRPPIRKTKGYRSSDVSHIGTITRSCGLQMHPKNPLITDDGDFASSASSD